MFQTISIFWNIGSFSQNIFMVITCSEMKDTLYFFVIVSSGAPYVLTMLGHCPKKSIHYTQYTHHSQCPAGPVLQERSRTWRGRFSHWQAGWPGDVGMPLFSFWHFSFWHFGILLYDAGILKYHPGTMLSPARARLWKSSILEFQSLALALCCLLMNCCSLTIVLCCLLLKCQMLSLALFCLLVSPDPCIICSAAGQL